MLALLLVLLVAQGHALYEDDADLDMGTNARYVTCRTGESKIYELQPERMRCLETCVPSRLVYSQDALEAPFLHESVCAHLGYTKYYATTQSHYVSLLLDYDVYVL